MLGPVGIIRVGRSVFHSSKMDEHGGGGSGTDMKWISPLQENRGIINHNLITFDRYKFSGNQTYYSWFGMAKWPNHLYKTMVILNVTWHKMVRFPYIKYVDGGDGPPKRTRITMSMGLCLMSSWGRTQRLVSSRDSMGDDNANAMDERCF